MPSAVLSCLALTLFRELGNKEFNSNDTRGPKSVSSFIIKLSELAPRLIIKQMTLLAKQLDSEVIMANKKLCCSFTHEYRHTLSAVQSSKFVETSLLILADKRNPATTTKPRSTPFSMYWKSVSSTSTLTAGAVRSRYLCEFVILSKSSPRDDSPRLSWQPEAWRTRAVTSGVMQLNSCPSLSPRTHSV